jgi:hypothetical protein
VGILKDKHFGEMKSPRAGLHPAPMIIWGFHVAIKNSRARAGRTKNKHMKSQRPGAHPAHMSIGDSIWQN